MNSDVAHRQIRSALRAELKRRHGQIGQIEAELSRSEGYLSRFCRGDMELTLKGCLDALEALQLEPGAFFSTAFGTMVTSEDIVGRLAGDQCKDKGLVAIDQALADYEENAGEAGEPRRHHHASVEELVSQSIEVQLRRLRTAKKYRGEEFLRSYLDWLEAYRFDEPKIAMRLLLGTIQYALPYAAASERSRTKLFCMALASYAGCARAQDKIQTAFGVILRGLRLADRDESRLLRAELLKRAGAFCASIPSYETGLHLIREAVELSVEAGDDRMLGTGLIARGVLLFYAGNGPRAEQAFQRGLALLHSSDDRESRMSKLSAFSGLVAICIDANRHDEAGSWLAKAVTTFRSDGGLILGKLFWHKGSLERAAGERTAAIESYTEALKHLGAGSVLDCALVSVELASTLLEVGRNAEAVFIAKSMASLTDAMRENQIAQAALVEFLRVVLNGGLNESLLLQLKAELESGRSKRNARK